MNSREKPWGMYEDLFSKFLVPDKSLDGPSVAHPHPLYTAEAGISVQKAAKIMAAQHVRRLH